MKMNKWFALGAMMIAGVMTSTPGARAQSGSGVGGGKFSEEEIAIFYGRLKTYFATDEWKDTFLKVVKYNETHKEKFIDLMRSVSFKVVNHKVYAPNGDERDCVPMLRDNIRWIECNSEYIPENTLDNQPTLYSFLLHEIFVYAGIEEAKGIWLPSTYEESWKMADKANLSLVTQKVWMPGHSNHTEPTIRQTGFICLSELDYNIQWKSRKTVGFLWLTSGDWVLFKHHVPYFEATRGLTGTTQYPLSDPKAKRMWNKEARLNWIGRLLGRQVRTEIIARENLPIVENRNASTIDAPSIPFGDNKLTYIRLMLDFEISKFTRSYSGDVPRTFSANLAYGRGWYRHHVQLSCEPFSEWMLQSLPKKERLLNSKAGDVIRQELIEKLGRYNDGE